MQSQSKKYVTNIALNIIVAVLYAIEYDYAYSDFVFKAFGYMDLTHVDISCVDYCFMIILSAFPIIFYKGFQNVACALSLFIYVFVYIPFINCIFTADWPIEIRVTYGIIFITLMIIYFLTDLKSSFNSLIQSRHSYLSFKTLEIITIILFLIVIAFNLGRIRFVNIFSQAELMYELRAENNANRNIFITYFILWIGHAFLPILLVTYYVRKQRTRFLLAIAGYILVFMLDMQKITFLIPFVMWLMLYYYSKHKESFRKTFHIFMMTVLLIPSLLCTRFYEKNPALLGAGLLLIVRTQCIAGEQLDRYVRFFEVKKNPYTNYAHINLINSITGEYPYGDKSIGQAVADDGTNSNATYLLMDGVAAKGSFGTLIIGILFLMFKNIINSLGRRYDNMYVIIILFFGIFSMLNTSLFTSILSFGFLIVYLILLKFRINELEKY